MTSPGMLPYFLALEPSPCDGQVAFAVARAAADDAEAGVAVVVEDGASRVEVFRFSRFAEVSIAWSADAGGLALAQGRTVMARDAQGALRLISLQDDVRALGFDRAGRLWCLAGDRLEAWSEGELVVARQGVDDVAFGDAVVFCRREPAGLRLYGCDGGREWLIASVGETPDAVKLSNAGAYVAMTLLSPPVEDRVDASVHLFDLETGRADRLLHRRLPAGFNAGPGLTVAVSAAGEVYAAYEDGDCARIWSLAADQAPQPVSPDGFEVFDFALRLDGAGVAAIASDTRTPEGVFDRQILVGRRSADGWWFQPPVAGVHDSPRWRSDGRLEVLTGDSGSWLKSTYDPGQLPARPRVSILASRLGTGATQLDLLTLPGPGHRRSGIILAPRLHQQFVAGAQTFFFHHLLFQVARGLALDGHTVVTLSGPGSIGCGRARREPEGAYADLLKAALEEVAQTLRRAGCRAVGLFGGSLAAVPAIRLLGQGSPFSAGAFVAPLFEASIPVTTPVRRHLMDRACIKTLDAAAADLAAPVLVIHGARDEVAPLAQVASFLRGVSDEALVDICIVEDEGHIFRKPQTWNLMQSRIQDFFAAHLTIGEGPEGGPA